MKGPRNEAAKLANFVVRDCWTVPDDAKLMVMLLYLAIAVVVAVVFACPVDWRNSWVVFDPVAVVAVKNDWIAFVVERHGRVLVAAEWCDGCVDEPAAGDFANPIVSEASTLGK